MIESLDAVVRSLAHAAGVAIGQKLPFKNRGKIIVNQMMNYAVAEIGGENFPLDRTVDDETDAPAWFVLPIDYLVV